MPSFPVGTKKLERRIPEESLRATVQHQLLRTELRSNAVRHGKTTLVTVLDVTARSLEDSIELDVVLRFVEMLGENVYLNRKEPPL